MATRTARTATAAEITSRIDAQMARDEATAFIERLGALDAAAIQPLADRYVAAESLQWLIRRAATLPATGLAAYVAALAAECQEDGGAAGFVAGLADPHLTVWRDLVLCHLPKSEGARLYRVDLATAAAKVTTNDDQRLYIIPAVRNDGRIDGYTCLGFEVCEEKISAYCSWLRTQPPAGEVGTVARYEQYRAICQEVKNAVPLRGKCTAELTPQLIGLEGQRVEVVDKYGDKRRFWVSRSMGWIPCHIEIPRRGDDGGAAVFGAPFKSVQVISK